MKTLLFTLQLTFLCLFTFSQQIPNGLTATNGQFIGFYEFKPYDYNNNSAKYPLIIFLHGVGERGNGTTELYKVAWNAIPRYCANGATMTFNYNGSQQSFMVLSPQLSSSFGAWDNFYVDEMINYAKQNLRVDPNRIYLCGLSLGGGGVWKYVTASADNAKKIAAIAPVCAISDGSNYCNIAQQALPVWAFHALDDGVIHYTHTTYCINQINNCNPIVAPKATYYPDGGHGIWDRAFDMGHTFQSPENVYEWFLSKNRGPVSQPPPPPANQPPVAKAGADISLRLPSTSATLDGSGSTDADGAITTYSWTKISGPAQGTISSPNSATTVLEGLNIGSYVFRLTVTDNIGATATDDVTVIVEANNVISNVPPVANAGADITITLPVNSTTLNGSASSDPDGTITTYAWSQVGGPSQYTITNPNGANTSLTNLVQGTYYFQLIVGDNAGGASTDLVIVTVNAASAVNQPPVSNAGADITLTLPTNSTTLNGSGSSDPDGTIVSYAWSKVGGPSQGAIANPGSANTAVNNLVQGTYYFQLIVGDNAGGATTDLMIVTVNAAGVGVVNQVPIARAGADITQTLPTNNTTLNGSSSTDSDGTISSYAWTKVSGPATFNIGSPNSANTQISNLVQGTYTFRLTVTDNSGDRGTDDVVVTVNANTGVNQLPVARAGADVTITLPVNSGTLNASASYDPDGTISYYGWSRISGPAQYAIENPWGRTTALTNLVQGTYSFLLVVTDNKGDIAKDTVVFTVNAATQQNNNNANNNGGLNIGIPIPVNAPISAANINKQTLKVFPNPAVSQLNVQYEHPGKGKIRIQVTDAAGKLVLSQDVMKEQTTILKPLNINNLQPGMYYLEVVQANGIKMVRAFIKQ